MTNNKITFRRLLSSTAVALAAATTGMARTLPTGPTPAPAPAPGSENLLALLQSLQSDVFLDSLVCSEHDDTCHRDGALPPVAKDLQLEAPRRLTRAPHLPGATHAKGCAVSGTYAVPLQVEGQAEPIPVIFDTGSSMLAVADEDAALFSTNATTGLPDRAPPAAVPSLAADSALEESNLTTSAQYGKGSWDGEAILGHVGFAGGPEIRAMDFSLITSSIDLLPAIDQCNIDAPQPSSMRGILGMGSRPAPAISTEAFLSRALAQDPTFSFSFAPCHRDANLFWQPPPAHLVRGAMAYARTAILSTHSHATDLAYVEVGGERLPFAPEALGNLLFDTGSTLMSFTAPLMQSIADALARQTGRDAWSVTLSGSESGLGCLALPKNVDFGALDDALPKLTLGVPSADPGEAGKVHRITLSASNYLLVRFTSLGDRVLCAQVGATDQMNILGVGAMIGHVVHFDEANLRVGIGQGQGTCADS